MNDEHRTPPPADDRLERAMDAMRTIDGVRLPAHVATRVHPRQHISFRRVAAAAAVAAVVAAGASVVLRSSATPAFADVVKRVEATRTLRAVLDVGSNAKLTVLVLGARSRVEDGKQISIHDAVSGERITLDPARRVAVRTAMRGQPALNIVEFLRNMGTRATRPIEGREIDGVKTLGFEGTFDGALVGDEGPQHVRVFVDPATSLPLRIEQLTGNVPPKVQGAFEKIEFDVPLDDALFGLKAPNGYTLEEGGGVFAEQLKAAATTQEAETLIIKPGVGLGEVRFGMTGDEIKARLGEPDLIARGGTSFEYYSRGFSLFVDKRAGLSIITAYSRQYLTMTNVHDFLGRTDRGIGIGSTRDEVIAAYGEPDREHDPRSAGLRYGALQLQLVLANDKVVGMLATGRGKSPTTQHDR